jgi:hypothetical protein
MAKKEYNDDVDMFFSSGKKWQADVWLPADAQITEIHLRVYSFAFPENIYAISWETIRLKAGRIQIPIDAAMKGNSVKEEAVRLAFDITYYSDL